RRAQREPGFRAPGRARGPRPANALPVPDGQEGVRRGDAESASPLLKKAAMKIVAIILIVLGALALAYGGFSYTKDKTAVKLGPLELSVKEKETVNVPVWAGVGAIVVGGLLLV